MKECNGWAEIIECIPGVVFDVACPPGFAGRRRLSRARSGSRAAVRYRLPALAGGPLPVTACPPWFTGRYPPGRDAAERWRAE